MRGVARSPEAASWLEASGGSPVRTNLFEAVSGTGAVQGSAAVLHFATRIPSLWQMRKASAWAEIDRLRRVGTRLLFDAALAVGAGVFVQESITSFYADGGGRWLEEHSPVKPPWLAAAPAVDAEAETFGSAKGAGRGVVLRFSRLYGRRGASDEFVSMVARGGP